MRKFYHSATKKTALLKFFSLLAICLTLFRQAGAQANVALQYTGTANNIINGLPNQQYLTLPNGIVQSLNGDFTIEAWVYWTEPGMWQRVFDFGTGTANCMFLTTNSDANVARFAFIVGGTVEVLDASIPIPLNTWTHVAITVNSSNVGTFYIQGINRGTATITLRPSALGNTNNNWLGKSQFPDPTFNGVIDELRISNTVRYTTNFSPPYSEFSNDANTVALFHFNEGSGQTTADVTGTLIANLGITAAVEPDLDPEWFVGSILPVKLESFTARKSNNTVDLKWKASATGEGGQFIVERSSDGSQFHKIGTVEIAVTDNSVEYNFKDASPVHGKNFYRLTIAELNAAPKLSNIIWVDMSGKDQYSVHPTVTSSNLFINIPSITNISIYNQAGVLMKRMQIAASQQVSVDDLGKGMYYIKFEGTDKTARFIKL